MKTEDLIAKAINGNKNALEKLIISVQEKVYSLALRMLLNPANAEDATQEILIKVMTNLSSFRFESQFSTWVYRLAANYLITEKKILAKDPQLTFALFKEDLESGLQAPQNLQNRPDYLTLLNELRISCTMAMLLCLTPAHRMAYILGDIYELEHSEASDILSISKDNFRKQLSRARTKVMDFTAESCGLISTQAKCSCDKRLAQALTCQRVKPEHLFYHHAQQQTYLDVKASLIETQQQLKALASQQSIQPYKSPIKLSELIEDIVNSATKKSTLIAAQKNLSI